MAFIKSHLKISIEYKIYNTKQLFYHYLCKENGINSSLISCLWYSFENWEVFSMRTENKLKKGLMSLFCVWLTGQNLYWIHRKVIFDLYKIKGLQPRRVPTNATAYSLETRQDKTNIKECQGKLRAYISAAFVGFQLFQWNHTVWTINVDEYE